MMPRARGTTSGAALILVLCLTTVQCDRPPKFGTGPLRFRAFSDSSYWNTQLPADAPVDPSSAGIIRFLSSDNVPGYVVFAGIGRSGRWGNPVYFARRGDSTTRVTNNCRQPMPPAFGSVRIPPKARPDPTSDAAMTVYDVEKGLVYGFFRAVRGGPGRWSSCGGAVYSLGSNGLAGDLEASDDGSNVGHRGVPPPTFAVRFNEIKVGAINHVLKIAVDHTRCDHVFPMTGDECGTRAPFAPPEGTRIRIKPTIDLRSRDLSAAALTVATALQRYGAIIGDQSGGSAVLKLENAVAEGLGQIWDGVLSADSLSAIPLTDFEVIRLGFRG
jgi:hypothetical protein